MIHEYNKKKKSYDSLYSKLNFFAKTILVSG